jgi:hypothetical protein
MTSLLQWFDYYNKGYYIDINITYNRECSIYYVDFYPSFFLLFYFFSFFFFFLTFFSVVYIPISCFHSKPVLIVLE